MPQWTAQRTANAEAIRAACQTLAVVKVPEFKCGGGQCSNTCAKRQGCVHGYYKYYVYVQPDQLAPGWTRDRIVAAINSGGVPCYQGTCSEVYLEKAFDGTGWRPAVRMEIAREMGETSLMFLIHPTLTQSEIDLTCKVIRQVLQDASASVTA